jgi:hypothetical protein
MLFHGPFAHPCGPRASFLLWENRKPLVTVAVQGAPTQ